VHIVATLCNIPTVFHRFQLVFPILDHSALWTQVSVSLIYSATPFIALVAFITSRFVFFYRHINLSFSSNLLLIWINAIGVHFFFGSLMVGIPLVKDFGYVPDWLYFPEWTRIALIILSGILLLSNGVVIRRQIETLMFTEQQQQRPYYSFLFKWYSVFAPVLTLIFCFVLFGLPNNTLFMRLFWVMFILQMIAVVPFRFIYAPLLYNESNVQFSRRNLILLVLLFMLLIVWRMVHLKIFPLPQL
jgi:hypothetical protein